MNTAWLRSPLSHLSLFLTVVGLCLTSLGCSGGVGNDDSSTGFATVGNESQDATEDSGETTSSTADTGGDPFCGDQICDPLTETCVNCQADCDVCPYCGDGMCNGTEDCNGCPQDCEVCPGCGDDVCTPPDETCGTCPQDCTEGCTEAMCGDGICNAGESCGDCPQDCGMCPPMCGDGMCNGGEDCNSCAQDCGECVGCPNNICEPNESCNSCPADCGACTCPCSNDPDFNNFCYHGPNTAGCPMTMPGGYCDPNGDGSYQDGDWNLGFFDYLAQCG